MQSNNEIIILESQGEVSLNNSQFYIVEQIDIVDNEFVFISESKIVDSAEGENVARIEFNWDNWVSSAVEINGETLILNSNGDAQHKGYVHNGSKIHNKNISIWIQAKRKSTGAEVFTFGRFFTKLEKHRGTPFDVNRFTQSVKDNWIDIKSGNMSFTAWIRITDYKD